MGLVIDWSLAGQVARGIAGLQPAGEPEPFEAVSGPAAESERLVTAYTGLVPTSPLPPPEAVGRSEWIEANLGSLSGVLDPMAGRLSSRLGPMGGAAGKLLALEAGAISGFLAGRVLGQYEFAPLDPAGPARLLFVAPNLGHAVTTLDAEADQLLRWVALHETTHALQFGAVPWLREHLAGLIGEMLTALDLDPRGLLRLPDPSDLRGLVERVRRDGFAFLAVGPERRHLLEGAQAFMALIEGYAEHVMDAVGAGLLDDLDAMRAAMTRRRTERSGLLRVLEKLIGLDLKLRQYEQGKAFCDAVVARGGVEALNRAWASPDSLPSFGELDDPDAWLARTERRELGRGAA
ncbi:MAG TPA: zinc-dependent metalloprotease [Solirubrobacteraceae bacterium]|nr:zinc-dependent metalloprotease [Solirubrobacteraceae bacterium]